MGFNERRAKDVLPSDKLGLLPMSSDDIEIKNTAELSSEAKTHIQTVLGTSDLPHQAYIIYHGPDAFRPGEPALIINHAQYEDSQRNQQGIKVPCYCVKYGDGLLKWFPQAIQTVNFDCKPSVFKRERRWAELCPDTVVRNCFRVKGREKY